MTIDISYCKHKCSHHGRNKYVSTHIVVFYYFTHTNIIRKDHCKDTVYGHREWLLYVSTECHIFCSSVLNVCGQPCQHLYSICYNEIVLPVVRYFFILLNVTNSDEYRHFWKPWSFLWMYWWIFTVVVVVRVLHWSGTWNGLWGCVLNLSDPQPKCLNLWTW